MIRAMIVSPDETLLAELEDLLTQSREVTVVRTLSRYPDKIELLRAIRAHSPQVLFTGLTQVESVIAMASIIEEAMPGLQLVPIGSDTDPQALIELMRVGIREYLPSPFRWAEVADTLVRVRETLERNPMKSFESEFVYSFLPAKPGVGTSTIALNAAWACSRLPETRALLIDLDLNSGMQRFMLKLDNDYCLVDAAENAAKLDEKLWPQLVNNKAKLDILHSGRLNPGCRIEGAQIRALVEFARRNYRAICMDHSGNMEKYSIEVMQESRKIFLVTTPEISSLHLARERYHYLRQLELADRVQLLLNRSQKRAPITVDQIEDLMGIPVLLSLQNDYQGVNRALTAGKPVDTNSELGKQFHKLAVQMMEVTEKPSKEKQSKSIADYLSILPVFAEKKS
jgi:pilus assembly protein CpaE